jgi:hypothetical protein
VRSSTSLRGLLSALALVPAVVVAACSAPSKGALVLAISTDMQAPKDINVVSVYITTNGVPKFNYLGRVLPDGTVSLPSTLALVEPDTQGAPVRIRVIAFQTQANGDANARVLRDVLTTVPHQRTALLRLPLDFIDDGSGTGTIQAENVPEGPGSVADGISQFDAAMIQSKCDFDNLKQTSINGVCTGAAVDSSNLQPYADSEVFGDAGLTAIGAPQSCFDVTTCFAGATTVTGLGTQQCSFPLPSGADVANLNVALVGATGACTTPTQCYVPLPNDPAEGWTITGNMVVLAPGVCAKVNAKAGTPASVATATGTCPAYAGSQPVCEPGELGATPDAGEPDTSVPGCDGDYIITCQPNPTCGNNTGGQALLTVTGDGGVVSPPSSDDSGAVSSIPAQVDPTTCVATISVQVSVPSGCNPSYTSTFDLRTGVNSGIPCTNPDLDGGCAMGTLSCTVVRGTLDAGSTPVIGSDASAPTVDATAAPVDSPSCGPGEQNCGGGCISTVSNPANCGMCGRACAATETCLQSQCVPAQGPDATVPSDATLD